MNYFDKLAEKVCPICNKTFKPINPAQKYCSPLCINVSRAERRREWEKRTNYKEKQRERRQKEAEERRQMQARIYEVMKQRQEEINRKYGATKKNLTSQNLKVIKSELDEDPHGISRTDFELKGIGNTSPRYWEHVKKGILATGEEKYMKYVVNGISLLDDDFERKVVESIHNVGCVVTTCYW